MREDKNSGPWFLIQAIAAAFANPCVAPGTVVTSSPPKITRQVPVNLCCGPGDREADSAPAGCLELILFAAAARWADVEPDRNTRLVHFFINSSRVIFPEAYLENKSIEDIIKEVKTKAHTAQILK